MASVRKSSPSENTVVICLLNSRGVYFSSEAEISEELWSFFFRAMQGDKPWSLATVSVLAPGGGVRLLQAGAAHHPHASAGPGSQVSHKHPCPPEEQPQS